MALHVYRYRLDAPFTSAQLQKLVSPTVTVQTAAGGPVCDIQVDDTRLNDLDEVMSRSGYTRIATDPIGTPASQIRIADGTILTLGALADGNFMSRSGTSLIGSTSAGFDIRDLILFDHFISPSVATNSLGASGWAVASTGTGHDENITGEAGHPGILRLTNGTAATARTAVHMGDTTLRNIIAGGTNTLNMEFVISPRVSVAAANLLRDQMGLGSGWALANPLTLTDGIYIRLEPALSSSFVGVCVSSSVATTVSLATTAVVGSWYRLGFTYTPGGTPSVQFKVNGANAGVPITTNIPTSVLGPGFRTDAAAGTATDLFIDYVMCTQVTNKET